MHMTHMKYQIYEKKSKALFPFCFSGYDNQDNDDRQSPIDLNSWADSESESETEVEGAIGGNGNGVVNANTSNNDNNQSDESEGGKRIILNPWGMV